MNGDISKDMDYGELIDYSAVIDAIVEWIALNWTKSQMKRELIKWFPEISPFTMEFLITKARKAIRKKYDIEPQEYKGKQISFYEWVIRTKSKMKDKLVAAERLDKICGLEFTPTDNPEILAGKICSLIKDMENSVEGPNNEQCKDEGVSKADVHTADVSTEDEKVNTVSEDDTKDNSVVKESSIEDELNEADLSSLKSENVKAFIDQKPNFISGDTEFHVDSEME